MNEIGTTFFIAASVLTFALPRRYAALPILIGALYMTEGQQLIIGGAHFPIPRLLIAVAYLRVLVRGERLAGSLLGVDYLMLLWAATIILTSASHSSTTWAFRLGIVWTQLGAYFLFRIFLQSLEDARQLSKALVLAALPLAILLIMEKRTGTDPFSALGGVESLSAVRNGSIRAAGPFEHAILAGTVGAFVFSLSLALYQGSRLNALIGCAAGGGIVYAATSSSPMLMLVFVGLGWACWTFRDSMRLVRWSIVAGLVALSLAMKAPVYYLMARIDIVDGSQGWFRAKLIESSISHLSEWWLAGTDYTRHWMATGISANEQHTDMTNHFLTMGVTGGLALLVTFLMIVYASFDNAGRALRNHVTSPMHHRLFIWGLGATLYGLVMTFLSITLFDESVLFFWLIVAALASARGEVLHPATKPARTRRVKKRRRARALRYMPHPMLVWGL